MTKERHQSNENHTLRKQNKSVWEKKSLKVMKSIHEENKIKQKQGKAIILSFKFGRPAISPKLKQPVPGLYKDNASMENEKINLFEKGHF